MRNPRVQEIWSQSTWSKLLSILEDVVSVKITNEFRYAQNLTWGLGHHIQYIRRLVIFKCVQGVLSSNGLFYWRLAKSCVDPAVKLIRFWWGLNRSLSNVRSNTSVGVNVRLNLSKAVLAGWSRLELLGPVFWPLSRRGTMLVPKSCASWVMPRLCTCRCFMMLVKTKGRTSYRGSNMILIAPFYLCWELCVSLCMVYLIVSDPDWFNPGNRNVSNYL